MLMEKSTPKQETWDEVANTNASDIEEMKLEINELRRVYADSQELNSHLKENLKTLQEKNRILNEQSNELKKERDLLSDTVASALRQCHSMAKGKAFKLIHVLYRFKRQFLFGNLRNKKEYLIWLTHRSGTYRNHAYNPIFHIIEILDNKKARQVQSRINLNDFTSDKRSLDYSVFESKYSQFDLIILSIIDYDFRLQRPQHFAQLYAKNNHRVFYVNANFTNEDCDSITKIQENIYEVILSNLKHSQIHHSDWNNQKTELYHKLDALVQMNFISDALILVEYPNWVVGAEYLRERYGYKIVTDYLDDFTGFINPNEKKVKDNCVKLLRLSDHVVASSQFLFEIASNYNENVSIVRNGTEYEHFHSVFHYIPDNKRKVIGYYGAIAEWFDKEKVCYAAERLQDCDFIIIGEVTAGKEQLKKCKNIKLLGEQPYQSLPDYLKEFDVCMIPFDTSTNLIKATNPVKFYEYLSAGKKIVATNIPELQPYKDHFVYLSDTKEEFLDAIKLCIEGRDILASKEICAEFARNNNWEARYNQLNDHAQKAAPKVSIIVLTYNNLAYNKICIESILNNTAYPNFELIIVDNNSTDGTKEYLAELKAMRLNAIEIYLNENNLGFAGGNNLGIKNSTGKYVLLLNNDTIVSRGWLTNLVKHMEENYDLGMIGPVTNSIGNEAKIDIRYKNISEMSRVAYQYTMSHSGELFRDPNSLAMFCTLIKRDVIDQCGLLDENYKVGMFEDDDYAETVKNVGYRLAIAEDSFVHHFDGGSFKKLDDERYRAIFESNKKIFEKKWNIKWKPHQYRDGVDESYNGIITLD